MSQSPAEHVINAMSKFVDDVLNEGKKSDARWVRWAKPVGITVAAIGLVGAVVLRGGGRPDSSGTAEKASHPDDDYQTTCLICGDTVDAGEIDEGGACEDCAGDDGTRYCCGIMYQNGEAVCLSCGEDL